MGTVTIGLNDYDIFGTAAEADIYLAARLDSSAWASATSDQKSQALVTATRLIQTWLASKGFNLNPAEAQDAAINEATYELAFALIVDSSIANVANQTFNKRRVKAGSAEVEYFRPVAGGRFPSPVQALLNGWLTEQGGGVSSGGPFVSGGCEESTLATGDYGLTEGY